MPYDPQLKVFKMVINSSDIDKKIVCLEDYMQINEQKFNLNILLDEVSSFIKIINKSPLNKHQKYILYSYIGTYIWFQREDVLHQFCLNTPSNLWGTTVITLIDDIIKKYVVVFEICGLKKLTNLILSFFFNEPTFFKSTIKTK